MKICSLLILLPLMIVWSSSAVSFATEVELTSDEKAWVKENPVVRVHNETDWPPFDFAEDGQAMGYSIDYMNLLAKKIGLKVEYVTGPTWDEFLDMMKTGELDVMLNIVKTPERQKYLLYTPPYANNPNTILSRSDTPYENLQQLFGKTISVPKGFFYEEILKRDFPQIGILAVKNTVEAMKAVSFGKADAALGELAVFNYFIANQMMTDLTISGEVNLGDPEYALLNIATRLDLPILAAILSKGVKSVSIEEKRTIQQKWLGGTRDTGPPVIFEDAASYQSNFIILYIGILFAVVLAVIFVAWVVRGRPKHLTIRELLFLVFFVSAGLIVAIGILVYLLSLGAQQQSEIEARRHQSLRLANELKQSSDDLTRFARSFAITGESIYETYYQAIIAIRDGKRAHPKAFTRSYWDHVAAGKVVLDADGQTYSIAQRAVDLQFSEREQEKLSQAKLQSDDLVGLEVAAMNAVRGRFQDSDGKYSIAGKPDLKMARELLYGQEYHDAKAKIMKPIDDFFSLLEGRAANELIQVRDRNKAIIWGITALTAITIGFAIFAFFLLKRRIISPLAVLESGAQSIKDGNNAHRIDIASKDEIGTLALAFNAMSHGIAKRTQDLEDSERRVRSIIDNAVDGIIVINEIGVIRSFSPAAERIFGYTTDEVIGKNVKTLMPGSDRAEHDGFLERYLKTREARIVGTNREVIGLHQDGTEFPMDLAIGEAETEDEHTFTAIVRDITVRKTREQEIQEQHRFITLLHSISDGTNAAETSENTIQVCLDEICTFTGWPVGHAYFYESKQDIELAPSKI